MRKSWIFLVVTVATTVALVCNGMPTGAPEEACEKLQPKHKEHKPQPATTFPYMVTTSADSYTSASDVITVSLQSPEDGNPPFKGFLFASRNEAGKPFGSWSNSSSGHELSCSAITHNNNDEKTSVTLTWNPPADATSGTLTFTAAVVQNVSTFWVNIPVKVATASRRSSGGDPLFVTIKSGKTAGKSKTSSKSS